MSRVVVAFAIVAVSLGAVSAAAGYTYPRFQPVSVAFLDEQHGVLAEDDWKCQKTDGCQGRILVTSDGGAHWRVTYQGPRGTSLYPVRGTRVVYAVAGTVMIESTDAGLHWRRRGDGTCEGQLRNGNARMADRFHAQGSASTAAADRRDARRRPVVDAAGEPVPAA